MTLNDLLRFRMLKCETLEDMAHHLEGLLEEFLDAECAPDGEWQLLSGRALVTKEGRLSIQIFPADHAPAHFHVVFGREVFAKFRMDNGEFISGTIDSRDRRKVRCWFESLGARQKLNEVWENMHK